MSAVIAAAAAASSSSESSSSDPVLQDLLGYALGSYALGYYSPPTAPGADPEVVPPNYALGRRSSGSALGSAEDRAALSRDVAQG